MKRVVDLELLKKFNVPVPRYTSYPTAPEWGLFEPSDYEVRLEELSSSTSPISIYIHIPFCKTMCLYCGCSVVLNRKPENEIRYVEYLKKEIELVSSRIGKKKVVQLHFGGGTPTQLTEELFIDLMEYLNDHFDIDYSQEIAIEIDPRTVVKDNGSKLRFLREIGFNRVSFGVQDTSEKVQEAVKRRQSYEMTRSTYLHARSLGFNSINIDLIYGLPYQTVESFQETITKILALRPDRIALFSYAKVPWLKPHQKAIPDALLPDTEEKFKIYLSARDALIREGYVQIGMDHFARESDELALALNSKTLHRNFQGYTVLPVDNIIGLGITAVGFVKGAYVQNAKELASYYSSLDDRRFATFKGKSMTDDDRIRRWTINSLMCHFCIDKEQFSQDWNVNFDEYYAEDLHLLHTFIQEQMISNTTTKLSIEENGKLFVRNIASVFDVYLRKNKNLCFSKGV